MARRNIFSELSRDFLSGSSTTVVDIITFAEAPWGLNMRLLPVQKFILKCVSGDNVIVGHDGIPTSIREFYRQQQPSVTTFDESDWKIKRVRHAGITSSGEKEVYRLTTKLTKRWIEVTGDHLVKTPSGYRRLDEISIGDTVVITESEPFPDCDSGLEEWESGFLGLMIGNGTCSHTNIGLVVADGQESIGVYFKDCVLRMDSDMVFSGRPGEGCQTVYAARQKGWDRNTKSAVGIFLEHHGLMGKTCHEKRVPRSVFMASRRSQSEFLRCLFSTDGGIATQHGKKTIGISLVYTSCNEELIEDVRVLLRRFRIRSTVEPLSEETNSGKQRAWQIKVNSVSEIRKFFLQVGIPIGWEERYKEAWGIIHSRNRSFSHVDSLPEVLREMAKSVRERFRGAGGVVPNNAPSSVRANTTGKAMLAALAEWTGDGEAARIAYSDVCWDKVATIEPVGVKDVYDIAVPRTHNFVIGGIVVHNCFYGMPLDDTDSYIPVPNLVNDRILYNFTEHKFLRWLHEEGRCNTDVTEGKPFQELILALGRRGSKCRWTEDWCNTSRGTMTYGELLRRRESGERLSILTYDPDTLRSRMTSDFKVWNNGVQRCYAVTTKRGIREVSSWNHPYLVWRDGWGNPEFVDLEDLQVGDRIAISKRTCFGGGGIGVDRAKLLGYLQGDGGTTCSVGFTNTSQAVITEIDEIVKREFGHYEVVEKGKESHHFGYEIVKESRRFAQDGSQANLVKEWLVEMGCFGKKATEKEVPREILQGSMEEVSAFLSRLFCCGGWASVAEPSDGFHSLGTALVGYCSASWKLANGVRHLLQKFGIHGVLSHRPAKLNGKVYDAYKVEIKDSDSLRIFFDKVGIFDKGDALSAVMEVVGDRGIEKSQFRSVPKGIWEYVRQVKKDRGLSGADVVGVHGTGPNERLRMQYCPSRHKVEKYGENIGDQFLVDMGSSDVLWDEVERVDFVGELDTVDVEVSGTHIIGGDIISHNSTIASVISNYELYKLVRRGDPVKYYGFNPGAQFYVLNVAPTDDQANVVFDMIQTQAMKCPYLQNRSIHNTMTYFDIQTDADMKMRGKKPKASIMSMAGGCSSTSLRGRNAIVVIMDEMAFFLDNSGRFSGSEVYKALTPSVASFNDDGKVICISSPYAKYGSFYERFTQSFQEQEITLMFKMYSAMANPDNVGTAFLKAARRRDKTGFMCEYGGEFSDSVVAWVEDESEFRQCIKDIPQKSKGETGIKYFMGIDLGFKNDGAAVAIVHRDKTTSKIILDYAEVWFSGTSDIWDFDESIYMGCNKYARQELLKMSDIVDEIKELVRWFPVQSGTFDQSSGYALAELLKAKGLKQIRMENFTDRKNHEVYQLTKRLYSEQLLELYDHPVLVPEILALEGEKRSKNITVVRAPKRRGAHDDISDAFARAVWLCYREFRKKTPNIATGAGGQASGSVGHSSVPPELQVNQTTAKSFQLQKRKMHGNHPRTPITRRKLPGAVR